MRRKNDVFEIVLNILTSGLFGFAIVAGICSRRLAAVGNLFFRWNIGRGKSTTVKE
jgi:hypothetical protein